MSRSGTIVVIGAALIGLPNPIVFGVLAGLSNYVPYVGPVIMAGILFGAGLVTISFPQSCRDSADLANRAYYSERPFHYADHCRPLHHPQSVLAFLALAFWTWLWGPIGAFWAVLLLIVGLVVFNHLVHGDDVKLPD